jgi:leucyl aminopeptidase
MAMIFARDTSGAIPLYVLDKTDYDAWLSKQSATTIAWLNGIGFSPSLGAVAIIPYANGKVAFAVAGYGDLAARSRGRFHLAKIRSQLPQGTYTLVSNLTGAELQEAALGWLLEGYRFDRYRKSNKDLADLVTPLGVDATRLEIIAAAESLTRDLVNTPSNDFGPDELEAAVSKLAKQHAAKLKVIRGDDLLTQGFPMIHAVGRASPRAPRLIEMTWGSAGPKLTLVGKGVCFDTGGLDIKPAAGMGLMKKDMGGAATVMGLAHMIMSLNLPLQLRVLIPAVENAISGNAMRPQDILTSRKGLTVEINNTDAEGRLILADALALADDAKPDLLVSMATLTGSARVALGPDIVPFYSTDLKVSQNLLAAGRASSDPVWEMPFWDAYEPMIEPGIADLDNAPSSGMAGSITAALFLRRFVTDTPRYVHFDIYCHQLSAAPARPKGGVGQGARALLAALPDLLNL